MNFVAHYYIDRHLDSQLFVIGVSTPDLLPIFKHSYRLKKNQAEEFLYDQSSLTSRQFGLGVLRHFEADDYFHSSTFFKEENKYLIQLIRKYFPNKTVQRDFFVAHILFELMLDRVLVIQNDSMLDKYYHHWRSVDLKELKRITADMVKVHSDELEGYEQFIKRFTRREYLYGFSRWRDLLYVLKRILERVRIKNIDYVYSMAFQEMLEEYEERLIPLVPTFILDMQEKLTKLPLS